MGKIGVKIIENNVNDKNLLHLEGDFQQVEIIGPYKQLKDAYIKIMKEFPQAKEFYNIYLNSPKETAESELKTNIIFR